jgi:hypothetical protein
MSKANPSNVKRSKRHTDAKAHKKGRGGRAFSTLTEHSCHICGQRKRDKWGKVPRIKYGTKEGRAAHPSCSPLVEAS